MATWTRPTFRGNPYVTITGFSGSIVCSRTTGTVPCFFMASASGITATGANNSYEDPPYRWKLEREDGAGGWEAVTDSEGFTNPAREDEAVNIYTDQIGPEAAFVIRDSHLRSGAQTNFRLTLEGKQTGGDWETIDTETITVDPWSGTTYYFDPVDGDDGNDGLSDAAPKQTWSALLGLVAANRRLLIKSGTTIDADANSSLGGTTGLRIGIYGGSTKATVQAATGITQPIIRYNVNSASTGGDHVFSDLIIDANGIAEYPVHAAGSGSAEGTVDYVYFDNCHIKNNNGLTNACVSLDIKPPAGTLTNFGLWKTDLENTGGTVAKHGMFIGGDGSVDWQFMMGGSVTGSGQNDTLDHHLYVNFGEHACYRFINFGAATTRNYCMNTNRPNDASTDHRYVLIADNHFNGSLGILRGIDFSNIDNNQAAAPITDLVVEGNVAHDLDDFIYAYSWNGTVRDNILYNNVRNLRQNGDHQPFRWYANKSYVGSAISADTPTHEIDDDNQSAWFMKGNENHDDRSAARIMAVAVADAANADLDENDYYAPNDADPFYDEDAATTEDFTDWQALGFDASGTFGTDPGWNDPANGDFSTEAGGGGGAGLARDKIAVSIGIGIGV